jgi:hypothetical protein
MKTITLQIGNTDNKLTQIEWSDFVGDIAIMLEKLDAKIHFFGGPMNWEIWQNVAWVFEAQNDNMIFQEVKRIRRKFGQDSAAWTEGDTIFI